MKVSPGNPSIRRTRPRNRTPPPAPARAGRDLADGREVSGGVGWHQVAGRVQLPGVGRGRLAGDNRRTNRHTDPEYSVNREQTS